MLTHNITPNNCPIPALAGEAIRYLASQPDATEQWISALPADARTELREYLKRKPANGD